MPHPPVLVPQVGQGREQEASATLNGLETLVSRLQTLADPRPDFLLLLSPHQPHARGGLFLNSAPRVSGGLSRFGAPEVAFDLATPLETAQTLAAHLRDRNVPVALAPVEALTPDHGSTVPLYFLQRIFGTNMPPVLLGSPIGLSPEQSLLLGRALADYTRGKAALLASGDLSHRLKPGAPAGYSPEGRVFDDAVVRALTTGDPAPLTGLSNATLDGAGECGLRSVLALLGLAGGPLEVLSYEGPFGVGYCNALWIP